MDEEKKPTVEDIPDFLHDALLAQVAWDPRRRDLMVECHGCLRRNPDGSAIDQRNVILEFRAVEAIAAGLEPDDPFRRPSKLSPPVKPRVSALEAGIRAGEEVRLNLNPEQAEAEVDDTLKVFDLMGERKRARACAVRAVLELDGRHFGADEYRVLLLLACAEVVAFDARGPLSLEAWAAQYEAWWAGWKKHWDGEEEAGEDQGGEGERELVEEDTLIPAGRTEGDPGYRPPAEPAFGLLSADLPAGLLDCLRDHFEGHLACDWERMAGAHSAADDPAARADQARSLAAWHLGDGWGRWGYARTVDRWWRQDDRAAVTVRGIEHTAPDTEEDEPAENVETVWTFALKLRKDRWIISTHRQGWPPYGSAEQIPASIKPWLAIWRSGDVITGDDPE